MKADDEDYGARVRAAYAYANIPQKEIARLLGFSLSTLVRIENNKRPLTLPEARRLAELTGVPMQFLQDGFPASGSGDGDAADRKAEAAALIADAARLSKAIESPARKGRARPQNPPAASRRKRAS